ncbi:MAG: MFS transporter [Alistipes sp.]|nr:sugar MFS transporter [Rikenellaceae bacterium]MBQ3233118.1 MFS transporter [Alistipes sp.]MBQ5829380.1 MFS transporter [Alistipes sp.]MBR2436176.1 MFS transporter [Alistipes sp.]
MTQKKNSNVLAIIVMILLFGMISFVTNLASPMGDVLKNQFNVANWMGTLGVFANFIAYACMGIPAGNLLQKRGYKFTALAAVTVGFTGVGVQTIAGLLDGNAAFGVYLLGAFIAGFSMCMLNIVVNPMLNKLAGGGNRGNQLLQVGGSFNSFMGTAVIFLTGVFVPSIVDAEIKQVFPLMFIALAIFALAFVVILFTNIPENERSAALEEKKSNVGPMSFRHFVLGAVAIFIYVGVEVGIPNVLQKWLQNGGLDVEVGAEGIAATVAATYWLLMFFGRLAGAALGAKVSAKAMLSAVSVVGLCLVLGAMFLDPAVSVNLPVFKGTEGFGMAEVPINAALLVLCGLCTSVMWGGIFNLAVEGLGKYTEKASGIFMALVCGGGILPLLQNAVVDLSGDYLVSYWVIVAGLAYLLFYALVGSKNVNKDIKVE